MSTVPSTVGRAAVFGSAGRPGSHGRRLIVGEFDVAGEEVFFSSADRPALRAVPAAPPLARSGARRRSRRDPMGVRRAGGRGPGGRGPRRRDADGSVPFGGSGRSPACRRPIGRHPVVHRRRRRGGAGHRDGGRRHRRPQRSAVARRRSGAGSRIAEVLTAAGPPACRRGDGFAGAVGLPAGGAMSAEWRPDPPERWGAKTLAAARPPP